MRDSFIRALTDIVAEHPETMLITGDLGFAVFDDIRARFPGNFVNAGVAEQNMTAIACGMAITGARTYTYSIGSFPTLRCFEQIRNDVCYHDANVTIVSVGGGFSYGPLGMSHFAVEDLAALRSLPGLTLIAPSDPWQADELTRQAHARGGPCYLRLDKSAAGLPAGPVEIGKARQIRDGDDAVIFATGGILREAVAAADLLAREDIAVRVIDVHTIKPLDTDTICAAARACRNVVTLEEHTIIGGLGSAVAEACLDRSIPVAGFRRLGMADAYPDTVGDQDFLRAWCGIDRSAVIAAVRSLLAA
jgi:transketolase